MNIFTFDIDWAPDEVVMDVVSLLNAHDIRGTFFATHRSALLKELELQGRHEVGIHPNFNPLLNGQGGDFRKVIDELLMMYPSSVGMRGHSLAHSCPILLYAHERGIRYDSNIYMPYSNQLNAFDYFGLTRIPYNWEDDGHWLSARSFLDPGLDLKAGLNIFDFHPVHIYINTNSQQVYEEAKVFYQDAERLLTKRNTAVPGTRDLFIKLLNTCRQDQLETCTLKEYYSRHSQNAYQAS